MQLKSACAYTNFSFISVQNYNSTKIRPFLYAADDIFAKRNNPIIVSQVQKIIENRSPDQQNLTWKENHIRMGSQPCRTTNRCSIGNNIRHITSLPHRTWRAYLLLERWSAIPFLFRVPSRFRPRCSGSATRRNSQCHPTNINQFHQPAFTRFGKSMRTSIRLHTHGVKHRSIHAQRDSGSGKKELCQSWKRKGQRSSINTVRQTQTAATRQYPSANVSEQQ